jgi:uncharacterized protein (TIGR02270 family)
MLIPGLRVDTPPSGVQRVQLDATRAGDDLARREAAARQRSIQWDIYEEHLEEAAFLWTQWESALSAANYTVEEVAAGPEERLLAHLDALVLGGEPIAERLLRPALAAGEEGRDPSQRAVAAWVLLDAGGSERFEGVWGALVSASEPLERRALGRAFELSSRRELAAWLGTRFGTAGDDADAVIIDAIGAHDGRQLARLPLHELGARASGALLAAVLRAAQRVPAAQHRTLIERGLGSDDGDVRAAAIEAGTLLKVPSTAASCRQAVAERMPCRRLAMAALAMIGEARDRQRLLDWSNGADVAADALWALAFTGRIDCAERLLESLDDAALGPIAADSFGSITGLAIAGPFARAGESESLDDGIDADAPVPEPSPDEALFAPEPGAVRGWWRARRGQVDPDVRHVGGLPWSAASLRAAVGSAATWRRNGFRLGLDAGAAAALDLRTWARRQLG